MPASQNESEHARTLHPRALIVDGRNVKISLSRGELVITFGYRRDGGDKRITLRRTDQLPEYIIIRGLSYSITGEALFWCRTTKTKTVTRIDGQRKKKTVVGIRVINVDTQSGTKGQGVTGYPVWTELTPPEPDKDRIDYRRIQMLCEPDMPLHDTSGLDIHRHLIKAKIINQADTLTEKFAGTGASDLIAIADQLDTTDHKGIKALESKAAKIYFDGVWGGDKHILWNAPKGEHPYGWLYYHKRASRLDPDSNRPATDPVNATLNYAYTILEMQTVIAMRAQWLDPESAIDHSMYQERRYAGAMDLMEPARPIIDRIVLDYLSSNEFGRNDFYLHPDHAPNPATGFAGTPGQCSIGAKIKTDTLAMAPEFFDAVKPYGEDVAKRLHEMSDRRDVFAPKLTKSTHQAEQARRKKAG